MITLSLSYPPSVNRYWRTVRVGNANRTLISREGRDYRAEAQRAVLLARAAAHLPRAPLSMPVAVIIAVRAPDNRRRDLDNILKATLEALVHAGVLADDSLVHALYVERMNPEPPRGRIDLTISPLAVEA